MYFFVLDTSVDLSIFNEVNSFTGKCKKTNDTTEYRNGKHSATEINETMLKVKLQNDSTNKSMPHNNATYKSMPKCIDTYKSMPKYIDTYT